jgi:hypothetical protein
LDTLESSIRDPQNELPQAVASLREAATLHAEHCLRVERFQAVEAFDKESSAWLHAKIEELTASTRKRRAEFTSEIVTLRDTSDFVALASTLHGDDAALALLTSVHQTHTESLVGVHKLDTQQAQADLANIAASVAAREAAVAHLENLIAVAKAFPGERIGMVSERTEHLGSMASNLAGIAERADRDLIEAREKHALRQTALAGKVLAKH